jgi:hypothetical protein
MKSLLFGLLLLTSFKSFAAVEFDAHLRVLNAIKKGKFPSDCQYVSGSLNFDHDISIMRFSVLENGIEKTSQFIPAIYLSMDASNFKNINAAKIVYWDRNYLDIGTLSTFVLSANNHILSYSEVISNRGDDGEVEFKKTISCGK